PGIGPYLIRNLLATFDSPQAIYEASPDALLKVPGIGKKLAGLIYETHDLTKAQKTLDYCLAEKIHLISYQDPQYPARLLSYAKSPTLLYVKGDLTLLNSPDTAAIVGARRCSSYGKDATHQLATHLSTQSTVIISGLAKGTDSHAHTSTLKTQGSTIAVVGTGLDRCYPSEHLSLMEKIVETGAVISEFPPFTDVHKQNFLRRNEVIAMLSDAIYVMEASKNSGALYTAQFGLSLDKTVFALPGSIYDPLSEGSNLLIASGASIYLPALLPKISHAPEPRSVPDQSEHVQLFALLAQKPYTPDALCHVLNMDLSQLTEYLLSLELEGRIYQLGGLVHLDPSQICP
ncbi:MAG: DNA-processing protein DprA, partial [Cellulosilyticaceae bacterium]